MVEYSGVWQSMVEYDRVWQSMVDISQFVACVMKVFVILTPSQLLTTVLECVRTIKPL